MLDDDTLRELAARLADVPGVVGVALGGSRARGTHAPESDVDLGLYYRPPLDLARLGALARAVAGPDAQVTAPGGWGPWVDGGGWLRIDGTPVDWIYRDVDRVHAAWAAARAGRYAFHAQTGHPLDFPDVAYAGEIALGVVLADPTGELTALHDATRDYPDELGRAFVTGLWEASFAVDNAAEGARRGDTAYVAGSLFRAVGVCAHALHGRAGRWVVNEKGLVASAGALACAPPSFAARAHRLLGALGTTPDELTAAIVDAGALVAAVAQACERP